MTICSPQNLIMIGAYGHAKSLYDAIVSTGGMVMAYVDKHPQTWIEQVGARHMSEIELEQLLPSHPYMVLGTVGLDAHELERRSKLMHYYLEKGARFPAIFHKNAFVSAHARLGAGVQALAGAVINHSATVDAGVVVNSGAVVEHDAFVGEGSHIAPNACVLGHAKVGAYSFVASGAVVIEESELPASSFIKSLRWSKG